MNKLEKFVLNGGIPLRGEVSISGAKNAVVAILPATILAQDVCVIENIPTISIITHVWRNTLLSPEDLNHKIISIMETPTNNNEIAIPNINTSSSFLKVY